MPNWCEGILKLRGSKKDLVDFALNVLKRYGYLDNNDYVTGASELPLNPEIDGYDLFIENKSMIENTPRYSWIYFKDSKRVFLNENLDWGFYGGENTIYVQVLDIKQAWDIDTEYLLKLAQEYHLDVKFNGFEMGMQFTREIEIVDNQVISDTTTEYDDYEWEVYDPRLGG